MDANRRARIKSIRSALDEATEAGVPGDATQSSWMVINGDRNIIAGKIVYQFTSKGCAMPHRTEQAKAAQVDWKQAPKGARWWSIDRNGEAHWFCEPNVAAFTDFWFSEPIIAPDFGFDGDFRDSLTERPPTR